MEGGGRLKAFHYTNFTLGPDIILNTKNYIKSSFRIITQFLTINASKRKHKIKSITMTKQGKSTLG